MAINFASYNFIAVGSSGHIYRWDGVSWTTRTTGVAVKLTCVHGIGTDIYAGGASGTILKSTDRGLTWSVMTTPRSDVVVTGIWVRNATEIWASYYKTSGPCGVWLCNGATWSIDWSASTTAWYDVCMTNAAVPYATQNLLVRYRTAPATWGNASGPSANCPSIHSIESDKAVIVTESGDIYTGKAGSGWSLKLSLASALGTVGYGRLIWVDSTTGKVYVGTVINAKMGHYTGSAWVAYTAGGVGSPIPAATYQLGACHGIADTAVFFLEHNVGLSYMRIFGWDGINGNMGNSSVSQLPTADAWGLYSMIGDTTAPTITNKDPYDGELDVLPLTHHITCDINDSGTGVKPSSVRAYIGVTQIYDGATWAVGWTSSAITGAPASYHVDIASDNPWSQGTTYTPRIYAEDEAANSVDNSWSFTTWADTDAPQIINKNPDNGGTLDWQSPATCSISDNVGVILAQTKVYCGVVEIYNGSSWLSGWTSSSITPNAGINGYDLSIFPTGGWIGTSPFALRVYAEDARGNHCDVTWSITQNDHYAPVILYKNPEDGGTITFNQPLTFSVYDDSQVDLSSAILSVKAEVIYKEITGWGARWVKSTVTIDATINGYKFSIMPDKGWEGFEVIVFRIVIADVHDNITDEFWSFTRVKPFTFKLYNFLFDGLRKVDEEND
jgi:hypothetical protein